MQEASGETGIAHFVSEQVVTGDFEKTADVVRLHLHMNVKELNTFRRGAGPPKRSRPSAPSEPERTLS